MVTAGALVAVTYWLTARAIDARFRVPSETSDAFVRGLAEGGVVSAERLLERAWDENIDPFSNVVRVTMATLRRKLGDPPVIETVTGSGYRL